MATFNGEIFLREQLNSLLCQTFLPHELIVCDDASVDSTFEIVKSFSDVATFNVKLFRNTKNIGFIKNFEKAISLCEGDYIALADQDDIWDPDKIKILVECIGDALLIHSDAILIDSSGKVIDQSYTKYSRKKIDYEFVSYLFSNNVTGCTSLFKKELLPFILPIPQGLPFHDWWFALQAVCNGNIVYLDQPLTLYRQHESNQIGASLPANKFKINKFVQRDLIYMRRLEQLIILKQSNKFFGRFYLTICEFIRYYSDYRDKILRPGSFLLHLKYFKYFHHDKTIGIRILALFASLLGRPLLIRVVNFLSLVKIKI